MKEEKADFEKRSKAASLLKSIQNTSLTKEKITELSLRLAGYLVDEGSQVAKTMEKKESGFFSKMSQDFQAKNLLASILDQALRPASEKRMANQLAHLLFQYGIPKTFPLLSRLVFFLFKLFGCKASSLLIPLFKRNLDKTLNYMIKPSDGAAFTEALFEKQEGNIPFIPFLVGDRVIGEKEAEKKLSTYLSLLKNPHISNLSIKTSHLYSQFHLTDWENSMEVTLFRLREIFRAALSKDKKKNKFLQLLVESYPTFLFNVELFKKILDEEEFSSFHAGITLQAYLPEAFLVQQELLAWAKERVKNGKSPIKITIVKGSYIGLEGVIASHNNWHQAPFLSKTETDANFKKMVSLGLEKDNLAVCHIGIGTHNLFEIAYAMVLLSSRGLEENISFEMLEGRTVYNRKVIERLLVGKTLLFLPLFSPKNPSEAITYFLQRIDDASSRETFLFHSALLHSASKDFEFLSDLFSQSILEMESLSHQPRRELSIEAKPSMDIFENQGNTDFTFPKNRSWANEIIEKWRNLPMTTIPLMIDGDEVVTKDLAFSQNLSDPQRTMYQYCLAEENEIENALSAAVNYQNVWKETSVEERLQLMHNVSEMYKKLRGEFIGLLMADGAKTLAEADEEVSEAIDTIDYYRIRMEKLLNMQDISWSPKGPSFVISSRGFPCTIPTGGIVSNLLCGNTVIFKPAPESVLTGWHIVNAFWNSGIPKKSLQFLPCPNALVEKKIISDPRLSLIIFGGKTLTAKKFIQQNPLLHIEAATDGKNSMIISDVADLTLSIQDLIESAFGFSGQKKSCASLAILLEDVYNNPQFMQLLLDATESLKVGSPFEKGTKIVPLIHAPDEEGFHALTTLDEGEEWLLKPKQDEKNPHLWSPGIKLGVQKGSFAHTHIVFAPLLFLMKARDFDEALELANDTPYGLTAGIHTLDRREQVLWQKSIEAGNLYINHYMTHAVIRRHPYGGCKASSFGKGYKAGGPNYLTACMTATQKHLPREKLPVTEAVNNLTSFIERIDLTAEELGIWYASVANYAYWWRRMKHPKDPSKLVGEDNFFGYIPRKKMVLRITENSSSLDILRTCAAALTCNADLVISWCSHLTPNLNWQKLSPFIRVIDEPEKTFLEKVESGKFTKIRLVEEPSPSLMIAASKSATFICKDPVLANGRLELLHYLREESLCYEFHRYGNLGMRETEMRKPVL